MRTNTPANQEYRPQPPAQSLSITLQAAECPQMWIFLIHHQSPFPIRPWCQRSYLLHLPLQPTNTSLIFCQRSSHALLFLPDDHIQVGDKVRIGKCTASRKTLINWLPDLARHWIHSDQKGMWFRPLLPLQSIILLNKSVANELLHGGFTYLFLNFFKYFIWSPNILSASNDVSMHFQEYIGDRY